MQLSSVELLLCLLEQNRDTITCDRSISKYIDEREDGIDMSINIGLIGKDGIVLAVDSRTTWQKSDFTYHDDNSQKLWQLTNGVGLMTSGYNSGYRRFLVDYYNHVHSRDMRSNIKNLQEKGELPDEYQLSYLQIVVDFAMLVRSEVKQFVESYNALKLAGGMQFILAGYDEGVAKIFSIDVHNLATPFVPSRCEKYHFAGVDEVGQYWMRKLGLNKYDLPVEFLKKFAVMVILETIKVSDMCGEPIQMAVIDKTGFHGIAMIDEEGHYHDDKGEIEDIKNSLDAEHKWLFDYLK